MAGKYEGTVLGLGIGCFVELPAGFNYVITFIARNRVASYMDRYDDKSPKEALGMFRSDRSRKLVGRWPAVTRRLRHECGWRLRS